MLNGRLEELLEERQIPRKVIANVAGVSEVFISYIISGKKIPSIPVLQRIAKYLDVSMDELVD